VVGLARPSLFRRADTPVTTLHVPPKGLAPIDDAMIDRPGIPRSLLRRPAGRTGRQRTTSKSAAKPARLPGRR
jgi:hypothetical protein